MRSAKFFFPIICIITVIIFDFIPVKFAVKDHENKTVFISEPKLGDVHWTEIKCNNGEYDYNSMHEGYEIIGKAPDKMLNKKDFDYTELYLMQGDNENKFLISYDEKQPINDGELFPTYEIYANDWEIIYPIHRASVRRFYAPKKYLTVYDFDLIEIIKGIFA